MIDIMEFEITTGFLMFWGGLAGAGLTFIIAVVYLILSARKARRLLKEMDKETF